MIHSQYFRKLIRVNMNLSIKLLNPFKNFTKRHFCSVIQQELKVQNFCDIQINVPYNVNIQPLDVHKYHNCDLLRIEINGSEVARKTIKHIQDGNNIKIFASTEDYEQDTTCNIEAPVKANLSVHAHGDISAGIFGGSKLVLKSNRGNIFVDKFQGDLFEASTQNGDIMMKGAIVASDINVVVADTGNIKAKRLQGLDALVKTYEGNITVQSSYCDKCTFEGRNGDFNLQNLHKNITLNLKNGNLTLTGLDGQINAKMEQVNSEVQIARILGDSKITVMDDGELKLQLSNECQQNAMFEIKTDNHILDPSIKLVPSRSHKTLYLMPHTVQYKHVLVECEGGKVYIQSASWANTLKLRMKQDKLD